MYVAIGVLAHKAIADFQVWKYFTRELENYSSLQMTFKLIAQAEKVGAPISSQNASKP